MYDQNMRGNIRFMVKKMDDVSYELESIYDPLISGFRYSVDVDNVDGFLEHFDSRLNIGKPYIYYGYLSRIELPNPNLEVTYSVCEGVVNFDMSGGLYNIFTTLMLVGESLFLSKEVPKFNLEDRVITNFGNGYIYDYIYDVRNEDIEYVCCLDGISYSDSLSEFRSIDGDSIKVDRDYKIDKILK